MTNAQPPAPDYPGRSPGSDSPGPYTQAIREGKCPLCLGTGKFGPGIICAHDAGDHGLHRPGDTCTLCEGNGQWPPPAPHPLPTPRDLDGMRGFGSR